MLTNSKSIIAPTWPSSNDIAAATCARSSSSRVFSASYTTSCGKSAANSANSSASKSSTAASNSCWSMVSIRVSRTASDTSSSTSPSSSGAAKCHTSARSFCGSDSSRPATSAGCNSCKMAISSTSLALSLRSSTGKSASICSDTGSSASASSWMRSISSGRRSTSLWVTDSAWVLINTPPA